MIDFGYGIHYPACNSKCDGDMHYLEGEPTTKQRDRAWAKFDREAKSGRNVRVAHRRRLRLLGDS